MPMRMCLDCSQLTRNASRCTTCTRKREHTRDQQRGTAAQRGYDHEHRQHRARLVACAMRDAANGTPWPCPRCQRPMKQGQELDLGHVIAVAHGGRRGPRRLEHARCNRAHGATIRRPVPRGHDPR